MQQTHLWGPASKSYADSLTKPLGENRSFKFLSSDVTIFGREKRPTLFA